MKKKMSKRILSIVLALTMTFSGLSLDGIKAYAGDVSEGETVEVTEETEILEETVPAQEIQAAVDENEDVSSTEEESGVDEELAADPVDGDGYTKEATIELPAGTYVENAGGEPLKATITWYYLNDEYGYSYRDYFSESITIPEYDNRGASSGTTIKYQLHYGNEKYLSRKYYVGISFGYDFKGNTNLLRASYYFNSKDFTTSYEGVAYDLAFASKVSLRVAAISGTLTLPSDVPAPEGNISYYIYVGNSYYTSITIPAGVDHIGYQISSFDSSKDEVQYFVMGYDYSPSYSSGLYTGWCYYDAATGKLVQALSKADAISKAAGFGVDKFKNGLNLTIPKASTTLTLTLPEGLDELEEEEYEGQVYAYYAQENGEEKETKSYFSFSTKDEKAVVYLNQVPDCAGELIRIMIPIGGKISGANTLLVNSGSSYYYSGKCLAYTDEGLICCEKYEAPTVDISEEKNLEAELLPTPVVCNVTAPEGTDFNGDDYLSGNIKIYYKETAGGSVKSVEKTFTINADAVETGVKVYFNNLSPDIYSIEKIEYVDNHYSYPNANIAQCPLFYTPSGPVSTEANAAKPGYTFGVMNEYELPLALAAIKVNIHHNPDVVFIGEIEDYEREFSYSVSSEIDTGSFFADTYTGSSAYKCSPEGDTVRYIQDWPIDELNVPYVALNVSGINGKTNIIIDSKEYITETGLTSTKSEAESYTRTSNKQVLEIDVTPAVTTMRGKFVLDDDVYIRGGKLEAAIYYRTSGITSDLYKYIYFTNEERSNEFFFNHGIPCDATTISKLYYHIVRNSSYEHTETNLMLNRNLYLAETPIDSETGEMRYQRAETGTSLPIPTDGATITFPIHKAEALVPVNITIPEGARVIGSSLIGEIKVQYTENNKDRVTTSFEILPGETEATAYLGLPSGIASIYSLEYYISTGQDCGTNVKCGYGTYTETGWNVTSRNETKTPFPYTLLTDRSGANPHIDIELNKARSISGTISIPEGVYVDDDVTIKVEVRALGEAESYADSTSCKCVFTKDVKSVEYLMEIPEDTDTIEEFCVSVSELNHYGCSNIINGKYFLTEDGGFEVKDSYSYDCNYEVASTGDIVMNFVLKQTKSIKGTIDIPEDAFVQGEGDAYVEMSFKISGEKENGSYISNFEDQRSYLIYPTDKVTSYEYEIPIDPEMTKITQIYVHATAHNGARTNLFNNGGYAMEVNNKTGYKTYDSTKGEIGWDQNDDFELETTETVTSFDITWYTSKVMTGTITFDEDCVSNAEGYAEIALAGFTKSNYTLSDYARSEGMHFDLNKSHTYEYWYLVQPDIVKVDYFSLHLNENSDNDTEGNVYWHWVYYGENGEIVSSKEAATKKVPIDKAVNTVNWTINASPVVTGTITLPENATYKSTDKKYGLEATIGFYQEHSTDRYELYEREYDRDNSIDNYDEAVPCDTVHFVNGARTATYRAILCPECKKVDYVKLKFGNQNSYSVTTNIDGKTIYYFGINGEFGNASEDITSYDVTGNFEFSPMLPTPKTLKGRISICEGGYFNGSDIKVTLDPVVKGKKGSYTQTLEITSSRPYADYSIEIPAEVSRIDYIEVTATGKSASIETNLYIDKTLYQGGGDSLQAEAGQATPIVFSEATLTKNIVLECYKVIMGKVSLPEDATVSGNLKGKVYAVIGTNTVNSDEFSVSTTDREASYQIKLPAGSAVIDKLYVDTDRQAETTVRTGIVYYNASEGKWHSVEEYARGFDTIGGSTEINMELPLSVELKGTISIPEGGYLNSGYVHGFVLTNDLDFGSGYFEYMGGDCGYSEFSIQAGKEGSCEYTISLPVETKKIKDLSININTESEEDSNAFTDGEVFLGNDGWQYDERSSAEFDFSSDKSITRNLNIPLGKKVYGTVTSPDYINDALVTVAVDYEGHNRSDEAYFYNGVYHYSIGFLAGESDEYVLSYILDSDEENYACTRVYVNGDDTYTLSERAATPSQFAAGERTITLARWSDFVEDVLLESAHPYANADTYALSYTYPGTADALKITFTDNTYLGEGDRIEILNGAGTPVGECYYSDALSGTTITIPGAGFTVKLYADESLTSYGFGISSIEAVNGNLKGITAASIAYENGAPLYVVIINTGDEDVYMSLNTTEYNAAGRMVSIKPAKLTVSKGMMAVELAGASNPTAVKTKYILYDSAFVPLIKSVQ